MLIRFVFALLIAATGATGAAGASPGIAQTGDSIAPPSTEISALLVRIGESIRVRDSLTAIADSAAGDAREILEELIWQRHLELHAGVLAVADRVSEDRRRGRDVTEARRILSRAVGDEWPRYLIQLERRERALATLNRAGDTAPGAQRLALEAEMTMKAERLVEAYKSLVDALVALERIEIDVSEQRAFLVRALRIAAEGLVTRVQLANRDRASAAARLSRDASNAEFRYALEATEVRAGRSSRSLSSAILLMDRLGLETTDLRVALIASTGRVTTDVFRWKVLLGLLDTWRRTFFEFLASHAAPWLFQGLLVVLTFIGFRALANLVRKAARRAVRYSRFSELMRGTIVRMSANIVLLIGLVVILTQLGVQIAPLMAGLGIAGFVIGFALQNTLANFAAGGMILWNQPYDVGDEIEVGGVTGIVKRMSFVSTTILTPDNQTLIVPNSTIWGGVIRNRTAQPTRRVDLTFSIDYGDDIEKAERALREVVAAQEHVLRQPEAVIRLHQLADSSVNFVVRAWTAKDRYWDVYWDLTRAVKLRFDQEGITIPFPQRELHVTVEKGGGDAGIPLGGTGGKT